MLLQQVTGIITGKVSVEVFLLCLVYGKNFIEIRDEAVFVLYDVFI